MNYIQYILLATLSCVAFLSTGCDKDKALEALGVYTFDTSGGEYKAVDSFGNEISFTRQQAVQFLDLSTTRQLEILDARFRRTFPQDYEDPSTDVTIVEEEVTPVTVEPSDQIEAIKDAVGMVPGVGNIAQTAIAAALGIGGLLYRRKKNKQLGAKDDEINKANDVKDSLALVIDAAYEIGDILEDDDGRAKGEKIIDEAIRSAADSRGVYKEVKEVIEKAETPYKQ